MATIIAFTFHRAGRGEWGRTLGVGFEAIAGGVMFSVLLGWTLTRPRGRQRVVAAAVTGVVFLLLAVALAPAVV
jgi:hypothetical protein